MKHKRRKAIAAIVAAVVLLGGVTAFACVNMDKLSGMLGAVLGIHQEQQADTSAAAQEETPKTLEEYAKQLDCLRGKHYEGYLEKSEKTLYAYDLSQVPAATLGYVLEDLDEDGQGELLVVELKENSDLLTSVYEQESDAIRLAAQRDMGQDELSLRVALGNPQEEAALVECYLFGDHEIGFELSEIAALASNGVGLNFVALHYNGSQLEEKTHAQYAGSDLEYDDEYMNALKAVGIQDADWDKLVSREKHVRDYVKNYRELFGVETACLRTPEEFQSWSEDQTQPLKCTDIYFYSEKEVDDNTKTVQAAYQEPGKEMVKQTSQTETKTQQTQNTSEEGWKQAYLSCVEECKGRHPNDSEWLSFWLVDIDGDAIPELYIDEGSTAAGSNLYIYNDGQVKSVSMWSGGLMYKKGANSFVDTGGSQGYYHSIFYTIKDGEIVQLGKSDLTQLPDENNEIKETYAWNDKKVSKEEYDKEQDTLFDFNQATGVYRDQLDEAYNCNTITNAINTY